jgi:hypothetical protein
MNIALEHTVEYVGGVRKAEYGDAFIRGNNGAPAFSSLSPHKGLRDPNLPLLASKATMQSTSEGPSRSLTLAPCRAVLVLSSLSTYACLTDTMSSRSGPENSFISLS